MKFSDRLVKDSIRSMRKDLGKAWDYMTPEVREAMVAVRTLGLLMARDGQPTQVATSEDVNALRMQMLAEARLVDLNEECDDINRKLRAKVKTL